MPRIIPTRSQLQKDVSKKKKGFTQSPQRRVSRKARQDNPIARKKKPNAGNNYWWVMRL